MKHTSLYTNIQAKAEKKQKMLAVLVDPDKFSAASLDALCKKSAYFDYLFVGGSLISTDNFEKVLTGLKQACPNPLIIFPGNNLQISSQADAILFLSLISGRNPELLIGQHVVAAPVIRNKNIEPISTGYMLIESGKLTTAVYLSGALPIPRDKNDIAAATALAGSYLGMQLIYMDAGSGASQPISTAMVSEVKKNIRIPLLVGGGIKNGETAFELYKAGADMLVIGNGAESSYGLIDDIAEAASQAVQASR